MGKSVVDGLVRKHLARTGTFASVDPPEVLAERAGIPHDKIIRLNANENPYGTSPAVARALADSQLHVYPDPLQRKVRRALAGYTDTDEANIVCGAGSGELIDLLFRVFVDPGDAIVVCDPTFGMYSFCAGVAGARVKSVPRDGQFAIDVRAVEEAIDARTKLIFINSPNNPTGNLASDAQVRSLLQTRRMVVVDEAYYEFCGKTFAGLIDGYENLVVLRTMSKWAGLAGLRVGYALTNAQVVDQLIKVKIPYNLSTAAETAVLASLEHADPLLENVQRIVDERERMFSLLRDIPGLKPWPSSGNYILCQLASGRAQEVFEGLARRGIFVRLPGSERLKDCFRVSAGTPDQTDAFLVALRDRV
ncbi:MAG: histidinol-phosphate transaminase [Chloroflexi bacterium]|nr:histidinol-phosphate transaminase [Chloroflexota bacterium]